MAEKYATMKLSEVQMIESVCCYFLKRLRNCTHYTPIGTPYESNAIVWFKREKQNTSLPLLTVTLT